MAQICTIIMMYSGYVSMVGSCPSTVRLLSKAQMEDAIEGTGPIAEPSISSVLH